MEAETALLASRLFLDILINYNKCLTKLYQNCNFK